MERKIDWRMCLIAAAYSVGLMSFTFIIYVLTGENWINFGATISSVVLVVTFILLLADYFGWWSEEDGDKVVGR